LKTGNWRFVVDDSQLRSFARKHGYVQIQLTHLAHTIIRTTLHRKVLHYQGLLYKLAKPRLLYTSFPDCIGILQCIV